MSSNNKKTLDDVFKRAAIDKDKLDSIKSALHGAQVKYDGDGIKSSSTPKINPTGKEKGQGR